MIPVLTCANRGEGWKCERPAQTTVAIMRRPVPVCYPHGARVRGIQEGYLTIRGNRVVERVGGGA
jgi:hypothetical protein